MLTQDTITLLSGKFIIGTLFFIRILSMVLTGPLLKDETIPTIMKVFLCVILAISLTSTYWMQEPVIDLHLWNLVYLVLKESMTGVALGFSANVVFWGARMAGGLMDFGMGFQASNMFASQDSPTLLGDLQEMMVIMIFLAINGHYYLFEGLWASVKAVPIGKFEVTGSAVKVLISMAGQVMVIGLKIAAPLLIAVFLSDLSLALLSRMAPQTNIFVLNFQVKIAVGLLVMLSSIALIALLAKNTLSGVPETMMKFIMTLNPLRTP